GSKFQLFGPLFPLAGQSFGTSNDPANILNTMVSAQVRPGVSESPEYGHGSRGPFQACRFAFIRSLHFLLDFAEQLRRHPAPGRIAFRHSFGKFGGENVYAAHDRESNIAFVEVA